jgi:hypothetical protein
VTEGIAKPPDKLARPGPQEHPYLISISLLLIILVHNAHKLDSGLHFFFAILLSPVRVFKQGTNELIYSCLRETSKIMFLQANT